MQSKVAEDMAVTGLGDSVYFVVTDGQHIPNALRDWKNRTREVVDHP